jgi:transposase
MLANIADGAEHIYLACGYSNFRKLIKSLSALVSLKFSLDPFTSNSVFLFCNKSASL